MRLLAVLGMVGLIGACGTASSSDDRTNPASGTANCQSVQHALGDTQVCAQPQRIIALGPNILELLLSIDVEPVGYADYFALPVDEFNHPQQQIPYLGTFITTQPRNVGTWDNPSLETIAQLKPDLILGNVDVNQDEYAQLSQIAPTLLFDYGTNGVWQETLQTIATVLEKSEQAETVIAKHNQQIASARDTLEPIVAPHPQALLLASDQLDQTLQVETDQGSCGSRLADLGFQLVAPNATSAEQPSSPISLELLSQITADTIILQAWNREVIHAEETRESSRESENNSQLAPLKQQWAQNAIAQSLPASQAGRVYFISAYLCRALPGAIGTELLFNEFVTQVK